MREAGDNTGPRVSVYQERTGAYHAPWCASFVTWALEQSGHPMPAGNWAAVANYVGAAQAGTAGLEIVSAADARPGDLVAYDWGHGTDFGSDGHIGLLASDVAATAASRRSRATTRTRSPTPSRSHERREHRLHPRSLLNVEVFELTVDYGAEELSALGRLLGAGDAPGLNAPDPAPMSADTRRAVHAAAWRGLVARRALRDRARPAAVVRGRRAAREPARAADRARARAHARPLDADRARPAGRSTCARAPPSSRRRCPGLLYRHTLLPREAAADRLLRAAAIADRPPGSGDPVETTRAALTEERTRRHAAACSTRRSPSSRCARASARSCGSTRASSACGAAPARAQARRPRRAPRCGSNPSSADALRAALTELALVLDDDAAASFLPASACSAV